MGQGQGPPEQPGATHSPQGEHGEDCEDGRSAPLTLTQPDPAQRLGDDHPERSEASTGRGSTPARRRGGGSARGETPRPYIELRAIRPVRNPAKRASVFGYQKHSLLPA